VSRAVITAQTTARTSSTVVIIRRAVPSSGLPGPADMAQSSSPADLVTDACQGVYGSEQTLGGSLDSVVPQLINLTLPPHPVVVHTITPRVTPSRLRVA
jgi:hypothetical protein